MSASYRRGVLMGDDAQRYAADAFTLTQGSDSLLLVPDGVSDRLLAQIRERGVTRITVDVSEFLKKGGGSVKRMIGSAEARTPSS